MRWNVNKAHQTFDEIIKKATKDKAFRKRCKDNPHTAIKETAGMKVPKGYKINIIENDPGVDYTIVLPPQPLCLKDEDMDQTSGGGCCTQTLDFCHSYCMVK